MNYEVQEQRMDLNGGGERGGAVPLEGVPMEGSAAENGFAGEGVSESTTEDALAFAERGGGQPEPEGPAQGTDSPGEAEQGGQAPAEEKPKRKRASRKKAAEGPVETPREEPGEIDPEDGDKAEAAMDDEAFALYLNYHFATCERADLLGVTSHALDIFQK